MATTTSNPAENGNKVIESSFAADIFNAIVATSAQKSAEETELIQGNIIISPLLLEAILALLYLGSDGATAEELQRVLQLKRFGGSNAKMANYFAASVAAARSTDAETRMELTNRLLLPECVLVAEEFQKIAQKYFYTATERTNFTSTEKLEKLLEAYGGLTEVLPLQVEGGILVSAVDFKNKWFLPFSAYRSGTYDFYANGTPKSVPMLFDDDMFVKFGEFRELDARAIELPFEHDEEELAMLLLLPNKRDGLANLSQDLGKVDLTDLTERMQMESVQVLLPKFKIEFEHRLKESLEKLGISKIFTKDANFKNLVQDNCSEGLSIFDILHKVSIEVNESGSEPSTVVANKPIVLSNSTRQKFFRADHPFLFAVRNRDITYFVGQVTRF